MEYTSYTVLYQWVSDQMEVLSPTSGEFSTNTMCLFTHSLITDVIKTPEKKKVDKKSVKENIFY